MKCLKYKESDINKKGAHSVAFWGTAGNMIEVIPLDLDLDMSQISYAGEVAALKKSIFEFVKALIWDPTFIQIHHSKLLCIVNRCANDVGDGFSSTIT